MVSRKVILERIVVHKVLWCGIITQITSLMLISTMSQQLIVAVKVCFAEPASRVSFETALVHCSRLVITLVQMSPQLVWSIECLLVNKNSLVL
jgi:hypothetical protein